MKIEKWPSCQPVMANGKIKSSCWSWQKFQLFKAFKMLLSKLCTFYSLPILPFRPLCKNWTAGTWATSSLSIKSVQPQKVSLFFWLRKKGRLKCKLDGWSCRLQNLMFKLLISSEFLRCVMSFWSHYLMNESTHLWTHLKQFITKKGQAIIFLDWFNSGGNWSGGSTIFLEEEFTGPKIFRPEANSLTQFKESIVFSVEVWKAGSAIPGLTFKLQYLSELFCLVRKDSDYLSYLSLGMSWESLRKVFLQGVYCISTQSRY